MSEPAHLAARFDICCPSTSSARLDRLTTSLAPLRPVMLATSIPAQREPGPVAAERPVPRRWARPGGRPAPRGTECRHPGRSTHADVRTSGIFRGGTGMYSRKRSTIRQCRQGRRWTRFAAAVPGSPMQGASPGAVQIDVDHEGWNRRWSRLTGSSSDTCMSRNSGWRLLMTTLRSECATIDGTNRTALRLFSYHARARLRGAAQSGRSRPGTISGVATSHETPRGIPISTKCWLSGKTPFHCASFSGMAAAQLSQA